MPRLIKFNFLSNTLFFFCIFCLSACSKISEDNFKKIQNGMTSTEVKTFLGDPTHTSNQTIFGVNGTTYLYAVKGKEVKVVFVNDKVVAKQAEFAP